MTLSISPIRCHPTLAFCFKSTTIILFLFLFSILPAFSGEKPVCRFDNESLPAVGRQETILHIPGFGRYAIYVKSPSGTAIQLIDRLSGPSELSGNIGETDGRLDLFLDRGTYKIILHSHDKGTGTATLFVNHFEEQNKNPLPVIRDLKIITSEVDDFQRKSYWLDIKQRKTIMIEAAGRNLADLRLWKEGAWLVDAEPSKEIIEPQKGSPLQALRLAVDLNPGLYQLSAYGGVAQLWSDTSNAHPLFIRQGIPELSIAGRQRYIASPFGIDRFVLPKNTNFFRLELPEAEDASLKVADFQEHTPYPVSGILKKITKKSLPPAAEILTSQYQQKPHIVTITLEAGKPYILQYFEIKNEYIFSGKGNYWVSTIHSGHGGDVVDATAIMTLQNSHSGEKEKLYQKNVVLLNQKQGWQRRFNLIEPLTIFLEVAEAGKYRVTGKDAKARFRFEPFLINRPRNYRIPDFKSSGESWDLEKGFYVLTAEPLNKGKGILDIEIQPQKTSKIETGPARYCTRFPDLSMQRNTTYRLYMNHQPGVNAGVILRKLPIDLNASLPVTQNKGETLIVPVTIPETGQLAAISEDGTLLNLAVIASDSSHTTYTAKFTNQSTNVSDWKKTHEVRQGKYIVNIENKEKKTINYALTFTPLRLEATTPLLPVSQETIDTLPKFPVLDTQPVFFDIGREEKKTFLVNVTEPAFYCLESTGLLETEGILRTRTNPSLDRGYNNGIGRNFMIQQYLREGDYQLTVMSKGESMGHIGIRLKSTKLNKGGMLTPDTPSRFSLKTSEGLAYDFQIPEKADYDIEAMGLNQNFQIRLEDADGWPILQPGITAPLHREFESGTYRIIIMPRNVDSRVVTLLKPIHGDIRFDGHGPHLIAAESHGKDIHHIWHEPENGDLRAPDRWCFNVPASVDAIIRLSNEMTGKLYKVDTFPKTTESIKGTNTVYQLSPRKVWKDRIEKGNYCLDVTSMRKNNRLGYSVNIDFQQLTTGHRRHIYVPSDIPVSIGEDTAADIFSFGSKDVRATLYNDKGEWVAQSDDRDDDWNFLISGNLKTGMYRLAVTPVADDQAETTIIMQSPEEVKEPPLKLPAEIATDVKGLHNYPLVISKGGDMVVVSAESKENIRISVEKKEDDLKWEIMGADTGKTPLLAVVLKRPKRSVRTSYRLRIQSVDQQPAHITVKAALASPEALHENMLTGQGVPLEPVSDVIPKTGIACVKLDSPGIFKLKNARHAVYTAEKHTQLIPAEKNIMIANTSYIWIMDKSGVNRVKADRIELKDNKMNITIPSQKQKTFVGLTSDKKGPLLVHITSRIDQPGISILDKGEKLNFNPLNMGLSHQAAVAVTMNPDKPLACMWNAGDTPYALPVTIRQVNFSSPEDRKMAPGIADLPLKPGQAYRLQLPDGLKQLQLVLPPETAAVFSRKTKIQNVHWSGDTDITRTIETDADTLTLLHTNKQDAVACVILTPLDMGIEFPVLSSNIIFKRHFPTSGSVQLNVSLSKQEKTKGVQLKLHGNELYATLVTHQGNIQHGKAFTLTGDASVIIRHAPGFILAWLEGGDDDPYEIISKKQVVKVRPPVKLPLQGDAVTLDISSNNKTLALIKTDIPVIAYVRAGQAPSWVDIYPKGADMPIYLSPENNSTQSFITLQAIDNGKLSGSVEILTTQATEIREGPGRATLLAPGDSRLYFFEMSRKGTIGLGVRASSDIATCSLLDYTGRILGTGVVQMHDLDPGKYLMAVKTPSDGFPVNVQPVLVNINAPDSGPPEEVIRKYME